MRELNIQKLLRYEADALEQLASLGVEIKQHPRYPNLKQFVYHILDSYPFKSHPVVIESRGVMLDSSNNWEIVAQPFHRFFNFDETGAAEIDWSTARIQEKLDGSLLVMYYYENDWHLSTRKTPGAGSPVGDWGISFADLFWKCWNNQYGDAGFQHLTPGSTYCWELTSPLNRVVTRNIDERITLLAVRDENGVEHDVREYQQHFDVVRHWDFNSVQAVVDAAEQLNPMDQEGYVVVDSEFRRVKIKSSHYVAMFHSVTSLNARSIVELICKGEVDEVIAYFPELQKEYDRISGRIQEESDIIDYWYNMMQPHSESVVLTGDRAVCSASRKQFAEVLRNTVPLRYHDAIFAILKKQASSGREWILQQKIETIMRWMNFINRPNKTDE